MSTPANRLPDCRRRAGERNDVEETLPHGGSLTRHGGFVVFTWTDGSTLRVTPVADRSITASVPASDAPKFMGGRHGRRQAGRSSWAGRHRADSVDPAYSTKLYTQFGDSWRISQSESLFDYRPGESTATFTNLAVPYHLVSAGTLAASAQLQPSVSAVHSACSPQLLDDCILDVGETGNPQYAAAEAIIAAAGMSAGGRHRPARGRAVRSRSVRPSSAPSLRPIARWITPSRGRRTDRLP